MGGAMSGDWTEVQWQAMRAFADWRGAESLAA
jgi:hypothetical protein